VADTGIGIAPNKLEQIFQPFRQLGEPYLYEGVGLGLPISRKLAELMGGELHVQSRPGRGSVFWLDVSLGGLADWIEPANVGDIVGYHGDRRKILVIDDNHDNRAVLVDLLVPLGFEVAEAADGAEGLRQAAPFQPDLILLDLIMPGLGGLDVAQQLRQSATLGQVIIIAVSASAFGITREQSLAAGCNDFMSKPVEVEVLLDTLQRYLGLIWVYAEPERSGAVSIQEDTPERKGEKKPDETAFSTALSPATPLVGPPSGEAALLFELARMGDVGEIRARLDQLEQADEQLAPFAAVVRNMAKAFELEKICELVRFYMEEGYGA
jgi:CheY-like chemotaxis protein